VPVLLAIVCVALVACSGGSGSSSSSVFRFTSATTKGTTIPVASRRPIAPVTGSLLDGASFSLATDRGSVVLVNFWAAWCGSCRIETPELDLLYRQVKSQGVEFLGVDTKDTTHDAGKSFLTDNNISYPSFWDQPGKIAVELGDVPTGALPFTILIDKDQRVAAVYLGPITPADLRPALNALAAEPA